MDKLHKTNTRNHAARRLKERTGLDMTPEMEQVIREGIKSRTYKFVEQQHGGRTIWEGTIGEKVMHIVYCKRDDLLVTFLDAKERERGKVPLTYADLLVAERGWQET